MIRSIRNLISIITVCVIGILINASLFAGLSEMQYEGESIYLDNTRYENDLKANVFCDLVDVAMVKVNNDPANLVKDELEDVPTVFALDRCWERIVWATFDINQKYVFGVPEWGLWKVDDEIYVSTKEYGFYRPMGIASDGSSKIVVADTYNNRLVEFSVIANDSGVTLENPTPKGTGISKPWGVCYGLNNTYWISDAGSNTVKQLDINGNPIISIGTGNRSNGDYDFVHVSDVAFSKYNNEVYVCDQGNNRIVKYAYNSSNSIWEHDGETTGVLSRPYQKIDIDKFGTIYATTVADENGAGSVHFLQPDLLDEDDSKSHDNVRAVAVDSKTGKSSIVASIETHLYNMGIRIENLNISLEEIWINPSTKIYYENEITVSFGLNPTGGNVTVRDYAKSSENSRIDVYQKTITNNQLANQGSNDYEYTPIKANGDAVDEGKHILSMVAVGPDGYKTFTSNMFEVKYDTTPPISGLQIIPGTSNGINVSSATIFEFTGYDSNDVGKPGCGIDRYEYSVNGGTTWKQINPENPRFHILESDSISGTVNILHRAVDNVENSENIKTLTVNIGWEELTNFWADWAYKVSDTEIWFSGGNKNKSLYSSVSGYEKDLYPHQYYEDVMMFDGSEFQFPVYKDKNALHTVLPENNQRFDIDANDAWDPNDIVNLRRRFVVGTGKEIYSPSQYWNKRGRLIDYDFISGSPVKTIGTATQKDIALNVYRAENPDIKALFISDSGAVYGLSNSMDMYGTLLGTGLGDLRRIKLGENGFYYSVGDNLSLHVTGDYEDQNTTDDPTDPFSWRTIASTSAGGVLTDFHVFDDGTAWVIGESGKIGYYDSSISSDIDYSYSYGMYNLNCIYMKDKNTGWIVGDSGVVLTWNPGRNMWEPNSPNFTYGTADLQFVVADKNNVWIGGGYNFSEGSVQKGVLFRSSIHKDYVPVKRPVGLTVESNVGSIDLSWKAAEAGENYNISGYNIYRSEYTDSVDIDDAPFELIKYLEGNNTTHTDTYSLSTDKKYTYAVTATYDDGASVVGETYYSNEGFATPKASAWKTVGTDMYPRWNFDENVIQKRTIGNNYFSGNIWLMEWDESDSYWKKIDAVHPYSLENNLNNDYGHFIDFDISESGEIVAEYRDSSSVDGIANREMWGYAIGGEWQKINYTGNCVIANENSLSMCSTEFDDIIGGADNIWVSDSTYIAKHTGSGGWYIGYAPSLISGSVFRMKNNYTGWAGNDEPFFVNGLFTQPVDASTLNRVFEPFPTQHNAWTIASDNSEQMYIRGDNNGYKIYRGFISHPKNFANDSRFGVAEWKDDNWKIQYMSDPIVRLADAQDRVSGYSFDDAGNGFAIVNRKVYFNGVIQDSHVLHFHDSSSSWTKAELPATGKLYQISLGDKNWIVGEFGQILSRKEDYSSTINAPVITTNLSGSGTESDSYITVSWSAVVPNAGSPEINGYNVYRQHEELGWEYIISMDKDSTSYDDRFFISQGGNYSYKVTAFDRYGNESSFSNVETTRIEFIETPTLTPTLEGSPTLTFTPTLTPVPSITPHAWPQAAYNMQHTNRTQYSVNSANLENQAYSFNAPDSVTAVRSDKYGNVYFNTGDSLYEYIMKISAEGDVEYIRDNGSSGILIGDDTFYYTSFDWFSNPTPGVTATIQAQFKARDIDTGQLNWSVDSGGPYGKDLQIDNSFMYRLDAGNGIRKWYDSGTSPVQVWPEDIRVGGNSCGHFSNTGYGAVTDDGGNIYFIEFTTNEGFPLGAKLVKFPPSGIQPSVTPTEGVVEPIDELVLDNEIGALINNIYSTYLIMDKDNGYIYFRYIHPTSGEVKYIVINHDQNDNMQIYDHFGTGLVDGYSLPKGAVYSDANSFFFIGTQDLTDQTTEIYLHKYNPMNTQNKITYGTAGSLGTDYSFTNILIDNSGYIYIGNDSKVFIYTSINSRSEVNLSGAKNQLISDSDGKIISSLDSSQLVALGVGSPIATPPPIPSSPAPPGWIYEPVDLNSGNAVITYEYPGLLLQGWNLYRAGSPYHLLNAEPITTTAYVVDDLVVGEEYTFIITGVDEYDRETAPSDPIVITFGTPTITPTITQTHTITPTSTEYINTHTTTLTCTETITPTVTETVTRTITLSATPSITETITQTYTDTITGTITQTVTPVSTSTSTETVTETITGTITSTCSPTGTESPVLTVTATSTATITLTITATNTPVSDIADAVDNTSLIFWSTVDSWSLTTSAYYSEGANDDSAVSPDLDHGESSYIQTMIDGWGVLEFYWKASTEAGYDYLYLLVDGVLRDSISGVTDWEHVSVDLGAGQHTVQWNYVKDGSFDYGEDRVWIDLVDFSQTTPTVTGTITQTSTNTPFVTSTPTSTITLTHSVTGTITMTDTETITQTVTMSITGTATQTISNTVTDTVTPSITLTLSNTPDVSVTPTLTITQTQTVSPTITITATPVLDIYEEDDDYNDAKNIYSGIDQDRTLLPAGDVDWIAFTVSAISNVEIETSGNENCDTVLYLYDSSNVYSHLLMDDDSGSGNYSYIGVTLTSGDYYIKVEEYGNDSEISDYTISLNIEMWSTATPSVTLTNTQTSTPSVTQTVTFTVTQSMTQTTTQTATESVTTTVTKTITSTLTYSPSPTITSTITQTNTSSVTASITQTITFTSTPSSTPTITITSTKTSTPTPANTMSETNNIAVSGSGRNAVYVIDQSNGYALSLMTDGNKTSGYTTSWTASKTTEQQQFDYFGITFDTYYAVNKVEYTSAYDFGNGGWFEDDAHIEVRIDGVWTRVSNVVEIPTYPNDNSFTEFGQYVFEFDAEVADGVRIAGDPGGSSHFIGITELEIYYMPSATPTPTVTRTITSTLTNTPTVTITLTLTSTPTLTATDTPNTSYVNYYEMKVWNNNSLSGEPCGEALWSVSDHNYGSGGFNDGGCGQLYDNYSSEYYGFIKAPYTGTITFYSYTDDRGYLYITDPSTDEETNVVNSVWSTESSGTFDMVQDVYYPFRYQFKEFTGGSLYRLSWSYSGQSKQAIPGSNFYHLTSSCIWPESFTDGSIDMNIWRGSNIGATSMTGSHSVGTSLTITTTGADFNGTHDYVYYLWQYVSVEDFDVQYRVNSISAANGWAKYGIMARAANITYNKRHFTVMATKDADYRTQWRTTDGGTMDGSPGAGDYTSGTPGYIRMIKTGTSFMGYYSSDNSSWYPIGTTQTVDVGDDYYLGIVACPINASVSADFTGQDFVVNNGGCATWTPVLTATFTATVTPTCTVTPTVTLEATVPVCADISFVASGSIANNLSSFSFSVTNTASTDSVMLITLHHDPSVSVTSVTYDSVAATYLTETAYAGDSGLSVYYIEDPSTGCNNVEVTLGSTDYTIVTAAVYENVVGIGNVDAGKNRYDEYKSITLTAQNDGDAMIAFAGIRACSNTVTWGNVTTERFYKKMGGDRSISVSDLIDVTGSTSYVPNYTNSCPDNGSLEIIALNLLSNQPCYTATPTETGGMGGESMMLDDLLLPTSTIEITPEDTPTVMPTPPYQDISLYYKTADISLNSTKIQPRFYLQVTGNTAVDLSQTEIRYYYSFEGEGNESASITLAMNNDVNIKNKINADIISGDFGNGQNRYLSITFTEAAGVLGVRRDDRIEVHIEISTNKKTEYNQGNDFSFNNYTSYTLWHNIAVYLNDAKVFGSTPGMGILSASKLPFIKDVTAYPLSEETTYNYPNPFSHETTIRFSLEKQQDVRVVIHDVNGKEVWNRMLPENETRKGLNKYIWKATNDLGNRVANGVYFLRIITKDKSVVKKIAVVR